MSRTASALCVLVLITVASTAAKASTIFDFSYSGTSNSGSGTFTADLFDVNTYLISAVTGTTNGSAIALLLDPNSFGGNNNLIFVPNPSLDLSGVSFSLANGDLVNLYGLGGGFGASSVRHPNNQNTSDTGTLVITQEGVAPEPSSLILFATGLLGAFAIAKLRKFPTPLSPSSGS